jgi:hypothetical protein
MVNWKGCRRKRSWPILRYGPRTEENTKKSCQDSPTLDSDLKPGPPKYEAGVLTTRSQCSACPSRMAENPKIIRKETHFY